MGKIIKSISILLIILLESCSYKNYDAVLYKKATLHSQPVITGTVSYYESKKLLPETPITIVGKKSVFNTITDKNGRFKFFPASNDKYVIHAQWIAREKVKSKKYNLKQGDSLILNFYLGTSIKEFRN